MDKSTSEPITDAQRFSIDNPCPICSGYPELAKGLGTRCRGWLSQKGDYAFCTREEFADGLERAGTSEAYRHHLAGTCACGVVHRPDELPTNPTAPPPPTGSSRFHPEEIDELDPELTAEPPTTEKKGTDKKPAPVVEGCTVEEYAAEKQLPLFHVQQCRVSQINYPSGTTSVPAVRMPYYDVDGATVLCTQYRLGGGEKRFKSGDKAHLYGLWRLRDAHATGELTLVEGASDLHTLWHHHKAGLALPSANGYKDERDGAYFDGFPRINVVVETSPDGQPDSGGTVVLGWIPTSRIRDRVWLLDFSPWGVKDVSALHCLDPQVFAERYAEARNNAVKWTDLEAQERARQAEEAAAIAGELLDAEDVLEQVGLAMRLSGFVGDLRPAYLAYLTLTSRLLERPLNTSYVAPSSSGKNAAVDAAAKLFPPDSYVIFKAASDKAIIYSPDDYEHRIVIFSEADSIPEVGPASSAIRSVASDNVMEYDVVEKDPKTNKSVVRHIVKPGPTGLLTTSIKSLGLQLGTRCWECPISDSEALTTQIIGVQALAAAGQAPRAVDLEPLIAFQTWLALAGDHRVVIPYAVALAKHMPVGSVRMRRDFPKLLSAIAAVALVSQRQRERDACGRIVATLDDYETAASIVTPVFTAVASEGVTKAIRETVLAINEGETDVGIAALVTRLGLRRQSVTYRVKQALIGGWLVNKETQKYQPMRLQRGDPLPDETVILPSAVDLGLGGQSIDLEAFVNETMGSSA